jgi:hypothetical protein
LVFQQRVILREHTMLDDDELVTLVNLHAILPMNDGELEQVSALGPAVKL